MRTNFKKVAHKNTGHKKKTKIGYSLLGPRKPNFKTKNIAFGNSHNAENCKGGVLDFLTSILLQKLQNQKIEGKPLESL